MFFLIFSVVVVDSSFNEIISMFVFEMLLFIILDYVNKVFIVFKVWCFDLKGFIKINIGIYVDERFWDWFLGLIQESVNFIDVVLKWVQVFYQKVQNDELIQWIFIIWMKLNDWFKEVFEVFGVEVFYVDDDINVILFKVRLLFIKNFVYSQVFDFDYRFYICEVWFDFYVEIGLIIFENEIMFMFVNVMIIFEQVFGVIWNIKFVKVDFVWSKEGIIGKGVMVVVFDIGVDCDYVMFQGVCVGFENFVIDELVKDLNGYGIYVVGIIVGRFIKVIWEGKEVYVSGVVFEVNIFVVKVFGQDGGGMMMQII